jgi:hypothetical protein
MLPTDNGKTKLQLSDSEKALCEYLSDVEVKKVMELHPAAKALLSLKIPKSFYKFHQVSKSEQKASGIDKMREEFDFSTLTRLKRFQLYLSGAKFRKLLVDGFYKSRRSPFLWLDRPGYIFGTFATRHFLLSDLFAISQNAKKEVRIFFKPIVFPGDPKDTNIDYYRMMQAQEFMAFVFNRLGLIKPESIFITREDQENGAKEISFGFLLTDAAIEICQADIPEDGFNVLNPGYGA